MKVIQNITGKSATGSTVDVTFYSGDSLAVAIGALAQAASQVEENDTWFTINSVRIDF